MPSHSRLVVAVPRPLSTVNLKRLAAARRAAGPVCAAARELAPRRVEVELELPCASVGQDRPCAGSRSARPTAAPRPRGSRCSGRRGRARRSPRGGCRGRCTSGQAPNGELNENWRGSSSGMREAARAGRRSARRRAATRRLPAPPWRTTSTTPSASLSAVSMRVGEAAAVRGAHRRGGPPRPRRRGSAVRLSLADSRRARSVAPSTRARTKPCLRADSNRSRNSPLRPRTSGREDLDARALGPGRARCR